MALYKIFFLKLRAFVKNSKLSIGGAELSFYVQKYCRVQIHLTILIYKFDLILLKSSENYKLRKETFFALPSLWQPPMEIWTISPNFGSEGQKINSFFNLTSFK